MIDLTPYKDKAILIRFRMADNCWYEDTANGWYIDDVVIKELNASTTYFFDDFEGSNILPDFSDVTLTAHPAADYTFDYWTGCNSTNGNTCTVNRYVDKHVTAVFKSGDGAPPTGSVIINNGDEFTQTASVTLTLSATDSGSGVSQMCISNTNTCPDASWESYAVTKAWTLTAGDGNKTVHVWFKDNAGNKSATPQTDTIKLDSVLPDTFITGSPSDPSSSSTAVFTFTSDKQSVTFECKLDGADFGTCTSPKEYNGLQDGGHTFSVRAVDSLGYKDATPAAYAWTIDTVTVFENLTVTTTGSGKVTSNPAGIDCGSTCGKVFTHGTNVTLTALPETGSTFTGWGGNCSGTNTDAIVLMDGPKNCSASFTQNTYKITVSAGPKGKILPAGVVTVNSGESQTFTITPDTGYHVSDVKVDNVSVGAKTTYTFTQVTSNHTISASFSVNTHSGFRVNSFGDGTDANPGDGVCETAQGNDVCTLRAAIQEANALQGADSISIPSGLYTLTVAGANEDDSATGDLDITEDLTIEGKGTGSVVIDGNGKTTGDRVLDISNGIRVYVSGLTFKNGKTDTGGGIKNAGDLALSRVTVSGNSATTGEGGGISSEGSLTLDKVTVSGNTSGGSGGGIENHGDLTITNSTISGNTSAGNGGALRDYGTAFLLNATISGNKAASGGGIAHNGAVQLKNTIVSDNTNGNCWAGIISLGHNLSSDSACNFTAVGDFINTDPLLEPLNDNGGRTFTHALMAGSPSIDAGDNGGCPNRDQRWVLRALDGNDDNVASCDIGSYEFCNFTFDDVPSGYWAGPFVKSMACSGISSGCGAGNYCPEDFVTRAQMAVFMLRALDHPPAASCAGIFADVSAATVGDTFCRYIEKFATLGITAGCGGNNFCPNDPVTRAQMSVFITKALGETMASTCGGTFNDVDETTGGNSAFCKFIEKFATLGITSGCGNGNYCPDSLVTRAQMAVFLTKGFLQ
jgi:CSLREA domain-containing protein